MVPSITVFDRSEAREMMTERRRTVEEETAAGIIMEERRRRRRRKRRNGGVDGRRVPRRRVQEESVALQRLFMTCRAVFRVAGTVPTPPDVNILRLLLDKMRPEDLGLSTDLLFFKASKVVKGTPRMAYTTIYNCDYFSMCIFFLPSGAVIPLHNHPGMTVFSKLLLGSMHVKSYDWDDQVESVGPADPPSPNWRLARMVVDSDFTAPCDTSILYPSCGGNMHTFEAITPCAILDVLGPPYSKEEHRDCTYYKDHPYSHRDGEIVRSDGHDNCFGWLEEIDIPKDLKMDRVEYMGPQIIEC